VCAVNVLYNLQFTDLKGELGEMPERSRHCIEEALSSESEYLPWKKRLCICFITNITYGRWVCWLW